MVFFITYPPEEDLVELCWEIPPVVGYPLLLIGFSVNECLSWLRLITRTFETTFDSLLTSLYRYFSLFERYIMICVVEPGLITRDYEYVYIDGFRTLPSMRFRLNCAVKGTFPYQVSIHLGKLFQVPDLYFTFFTTHTNPFNLKGLYFL